VNFFGIHFCADEAYAILMMLPFVGYVINWLKSRREIWRNRHTKGCVHGAHDSHENHENHTHE
jgi:hypothetical protein